MNQTTVENLVDLKKLGTLLYAARPSQQLSDRESLAMKQALIYLEKGLVARDGQAKYDGFKLLKNVSEGDKNELSKVLKKFGFREKEADWYADKIINDSAYFELIKNISGNPFGTFQEASLLMQKFYRTKDKEGLETIIKELETFSITQTHAAERKAMLNYVISRRYGDIKNIAKKLALDVTYKDETQTLISILKKIKDDKEYMKTLKAYPREVSRLNNLDVLGKYAFFKFSYPQLVKEHGNIHLFTDYLEKHQIPSQLQFTLFHEVVPELKNEPLEKIMLVVSEASLFGDRVLRREGWNLEKQLYTQGTQINDVIKKAKGEYLRTLMNDALKDSAQSDPTNKGNLVDEKGFEQKTEAERMSGKIRSYLQKYAPEVLNEIEQLMSVEGVKDPRQCVQIFKELMKGERLNILKMGKGKLSRDLGIALDLNLFGKHLNELMLVDPMPTLYTRHFLTGNGAGSYRNTKMAGKEDSWDIDYLKYRRWGPVGEWSVYGSGSYKEKGESKSKDCRVGSKGNNIYTLWGREVDYGIDYMTINEKQQLEGFLDAYKEDMNTFVHLRAVDEKDNTWQAIVYQKDAGQYVKVAVHDFSAEQAAKIYGGYTNSKADVRTLYENGSIKGLIVGYMFDNVGASVLKNKTQFSMITAFSSPAKKIGARVYTDEKGAKQLGLTALTDVAHIDAVGGKEKIEGKGGTEKEKIVYGVNLRTKIDNLYITTMMSQHLDTILALGVSSANGYFLSDYIKSMVRDEKGLLTGFQTENKNVDLAWYNNPRAVAYQSETGYILNQWLIERDLVLKKLKDKNANLSEIRSQLMHVTSGIDKIRTVLGNEIRGALNMKVMEKDKTIGYEYIGGDIRKGENSVMNYYVLGKKRSSGLKAGYGKGRVLGEYTQIAHAEREAATLFSVSVLSMDDILGMNKKTILGAKYGLMRELEKGKGAGGLVSTDFTKDLQSVLAGYYRWDERSEKEAYHAITVRADSQKTNADILTGAIGYGYATKRYDERGNKVWEYHIIVRGARSKDEYLQKAEAIAGELGLDYKRTTLTGDMLSLNIGVIGTKIKGYKNDGEEVAVTLGGYLEHSFD